jgi:uncharacterized protein (TIGR02145 family)
MKKIFTLLIGIVFSTMVLNAQEPEAPPQALSYKAIIRKSNGQPLVNEAVNFRISILQGSAEGNTVYSETFQPITNEFGQIDIEIGRGTPEPGIWPEIKLGDDEFFLKTEVDAEGGTDYQFLSVTQLLSVPYALYAGEAKYAREAKNGFVSEYTEEEARPVLHEDGNISLGPTINPYWDSWFKLNVNGPVNITTGDKSWGADVILNAMPKGGNMFSVSSVGSMAPCPGSFWITTVDPVGNLNYNGSIVMKYNGNVGINTLNPGYKLDVNGAFRVTPGGQTYGPIIALDATKVEGGKWYVIGSTGGDAYEGQGHFLIRDDDWSSTFLMDPDGKVGIGLGKGTPAYKLDIAGDINFSGGLFKDGEPFSGDYNNLINKPDLAVYATNAYVNELERRIAELEKNLQNSGLIVEDGDGNVYSTIKIGNQTWITENLKTTKYMNGDPIPNVTNTTEWVKLKAGAYCWYNNDAEAYKDTYGALYNWYTVIDQRKICPTGWHVPNYNEWISLRSYLGNINEAGGKLKEFGTIHWESPNTGATNETGFTALPGGIFNGSQFLNIGRYGYWWNTSSISNSARFTVISFNSSALQFSNTSMNLGLSVRCLKDN